LEVAYSAPADSLAVFKGPTSKGGRGREVGGKGKRKAGEEKGGEGCPPIRESGSAGLVKQIFKVVSIKESVLHYLLYVG